MTCEDVFMAAFAVGVGFTLGKEIFASLLDWADNFWERWKKPSFIFEVLFWLALILYMGYQFHSWTLF